MNSPFEIAHGYAAVGAAKTKLPPLKMFLLAVMAGLFIAFGAVTSTIASSGVGIAGAARLISGAVFPVGLTLVILAGSELFTGNCLIIIPVLTGEVRISAFIRCLFIVYLGNLIGSMIVAGLVVLGGIPVLHAATDTALAKVSLPFWEAFVRGVLCNILVCLAVWVSFAGKTPGSKIAAIYLPILAFVVCGFEHSVANMYYIPVGILTAAKHGADIPGLTWGAMFLNNLLPVTLGNMAGGMALGAAYWGIYLNGKG